MDVLFPTDTLKLVLVTEQGEVLWRLESERGIVPGIWFCPVFAFDLDGCPELVRGSPARTVRCWTGMARRLAISMAQ